TLKLVYPVRLFYMLHKNHLDWERKTAEAFLFLSLFTRRRSAFGYGAGTAAVGPAAALHRAQRRYLVGHRARAGVLERACGGAAQRSWPPLRDSRRAGADVAALLLTRPTCKSGRMGWRFSRFSSGGGFGHVVRGAAGCAVRDALLELAQYAQHVAMYGGQLRLL